MKKMTLISMIVIVALFIGGLNYSFQYAIAEDSKEVMELKLDRAMQSRGRIQAEMQLLQYRFKEGQEALVNLEKEIKELQGKIKAVTEAK